MTGRQLPLPFLARPSLRAADWVHAGPNAQAAAMLEHWQDWPDGRLALTGPAGVGKSHLASVWREQVGAVEIDPHALPGPEAWFGEAPRLLLDPIDPAEPRGEALLHLLNAAREARGTVLLVSRVAPSRWPASLADLRSRLAAMPVVEIGEPDDALLRALLLKHATDRQLALSPAVVGFLVARMERSAAAAERLVARMDRLSLARARAIGRGIAASALDQEDAADGASGPGDPDDDIPMSVEEAPSPSALPLV